MTDKKRAIYTFSSIIIFVVLLLFSIIKGGVFGGKSDSHNPYIPSDGKTILMIGQDNDETALYMDSVDKSKMCGMMIYTNMGTYYGMEASYKATAGRVDYPEWVENYDNTALNLALWINKSTLLDCVISGRYDAEIRHFAQLCSDAKKPIYFRFGYEFDGPWNSYVPEKYVEAYKRFYDVFTGKIKDKNDKDIDVSNVSFVWHSAAFFRLGENGIWPGNGFDKNCLDYVNGSKNGEYSLDDWYPGDDYVDWVGISWFQWRYRYQEEAAEARRIELVNYAKEHNKPVMIAESAPKAFWQPNDSWFSDENRHEKCPVYGDQPEMYEGDAWSNWYQKVFDFIEEYDVKAYCYINQDWNLQTMWRSEGDWGNTRVQSNAEIQKKWIDAISSDRYIKTDDLYKEIGFNSQK